MSCTNFSSNTQPKVLFAGSLPAGFCHVTWSATFAEFVNSLTGVLPDNYSTFLISDSTPAASDRDKVWVEVDSLTCRPAGIKLYLDGTWINIGANLFYGIDESVTDDVVLVNSTNPVITWKQDGHAFLVLFGRSNTGAATITIKNGGETVYSAVPLRKFNNLPLEALDYLDGMIGVLVYNEDSNTMRLTNPRVGGGTSAGGGGTVSTGFNLSFDEDADGDGEPDAWDVYVANEAYAGDGTSAETAPAGGSFELDPAGVHGKQAVKFTCSNGTGNGGGFIQTKGHIEITGGAIQEFSWWCKTNADAISNRVEMLWYDSSKVYLSKTELWGTSAANPNGVWYQLGGIAEPPASARYCKIRLYAGITGTTVGGLVWFDDFRFEAPTFRFRNEHTTLGSYRVKIPQGKYQFKVHVVGGGGAGGRAGNSVSTAGAGGGGGGCAIIGYVPCSPGDIFNVVVGIGGIAHSGSVSGGLSRLATSAPVTIYEANGGTAGNDRPTTGSAACAGGAGGTVSVAGVYAVYIPGLHGYPLVALDSSVAVHWGGNSALGAGGPAIVGLNGSEGSAFGGGGGGAFWGGGLTSTTDGFGGDGADGVIIIEYI